MRHSDRRRTRAVAWSLAALTLAVLVGALVLVGLNAGLLGTLRAGSNALLALAVGVYVATSQLIISRLPGNAIGWLLGLVGLALAGSMFTEEYAVYGLGTAPGSLPAPRVVGWPSGILASMVVMLLLFVVLLFPDGRLPSRRWRPVLWALLLVTPSWVLGQLQDGLTVTGGITNAVAAARLSYTSPLGIFPRESLITRMAPVPFVIGLAAGVLVVVSVFVRRRGASAELRKQLAWLGYVALVTALWGAAFLVGFTIAPRAGNGWLGLLGWTVLVVTPVAGIPLACAVAMLKYRLYEIDKFISRTLAYAIVTGLLVGVYSGVVLMATEVLGLHSAVAVAASTLVAAALFTPLRSRVQQRVDRRFNRARYDADQTLTAFAARLKDAVDQDAVRTDLLRVVQRSLEPTHATVWVMPLR
jgi:hypothetical protein